MADKQCFIYIVDQGKTMADSNNGRSESNLEYGMRYIWDKIATTMSASRKTWTLGVVGLRTDDTDNYLSAADEESYDNISIQQEIGPFEMSDLKRLQHKIRPSSTESGDAVSSIILAIDMIEKYAKKLKYQRKIVLMTNGLGHLDEDGIGDIVQKLNDDKIELVIIGIDFDDHEFGFKEEDKDPHKASNEALLKSLVEQCDQGVFGTMSEAIGLLSEPVVKATRPFASYKGQLTLGDPEKYETAMSIDVERYFRTKPATVPPASTFVIKNDLTNEEASQAPRALKAEDNMDIDHVPYENDMSGVKTAFTYKVSDPAAPGGKRDVEREDLARGYEYGRTAIPISESEENVTKLETVQTFTIVGFVPQNKYERFFNMGPSCITIAQKTNEKAVLALSSLIHALYELETYAVARLVQKDNKEPQLILLMPSIEPELESLIDIPLPFAEDVRTYRFPPLDRVVTISGTVLREHRNIPNGELSNAMEAYVDSMDLSSFGKDDEGNPTEYMPIDETYAPPVHRINQAVRRRAVKPSEPIEPPAEALVRFANPPPELVEASSKALKRLIVSADVKKVPAKTKGRRRDPVKPLSGIDVDALLNSSTAGRERRERISKENAIPEFIQMIGNAASLESIEEATKQMSTITQSMISSSTGNSNYSRALANIHVMRKQLIDFEFPEVYNAFAKDLKDKLLEGGLGGDRREFMFELRQAKLGLITKAISDLSEVKEEEASQFYSLKNIPIREK